MNAFIQYLSDVRSEMTHVAWPTQAQAVGYTVLVIFIAVLVATVLAFSDLGFTYLLEQLIQK